MEKLLANKNIITVFKEDENDFEQYYAYTPSMLDRKIFIEFGEYDMYFENEFDDEAFEHETVVSVFFLFQGTAYQFNIFHDGRDIVPTITLYRVIIDLVEIIDNSDDNTVLDNLTSIALSVIKSDPDHENENMRDVFFKVQDRINEVLHLIEVAKLRNN